jgi:outer membrane protein assembly factor BamB
MKRLCLACSGLLLISSNALAGDWLFWRGPLQNGAVLEKAAVTTWSPQGEHLLWKSAEGGRTTPIVMQGRVYFIAPTGEGPALREHIVCLDADTGTTVWKYDINVFLTDIVEDRLGWTALAADAQTGNIYAHTTGGEFLCLDRDGKLLWKRSLVEDYGRVSGFGGRLHTPLLDEERVIISFTASGWGEHAKPAHRYVAFDKRNGQVLWWAAPGEQPLDTTYATPVVAVIGGKRLLIAPNADGWVYAMLARTGEKVWSYRLSKRALNSSPVVSGNLVYVSHSEENLDTTVMGRLVCLDGSKTGDITPSGEVWRADAEVGFASPAVANSRVYVVDNSANLYSFDAGTGQKLWEFSLGRVGKGSPVVTADGIIYVGEQNGVFYILKDAGDHCEALDREEFKGPNATVDELFGSPAVVDGRVYFQTRYGTYCLADQSRKVETVAAPPPSAEAPPPSDAKPFLLVVPGDVTLAPGQSQRFVARVYTAGAKDYKEVPAQFTVAGPKGELAPDGIFKAAAANAFSAGVLKAAWEAVEASARVRICPPPPFTVDFESLEPKSAPPGWVNVSRKLEVAERDGSKVLQKLADNPATPFIRTRTYMTSPIAGGYTITADLLGTPKGDRFKPDMGLFNSRYELILLGSEPTLRITTWSPIPRLQKDVPFEWKTDVWYRVKLQVKLEGNLGIVRAKVWPREQSEPANWTIELSDPFPNREGSPALYAYSAGATARSKGTEVFYDNIEVKPND